MSCDWLSSRCNQYFEVGEEVLMFPSPSLSLSLFGCKKTIKRCLQALMRLQQNDHKEEISCRTHTYTEFDTHTQIHQSYLKKYFAAAIHLQRDRSSIDRETILQIYWFSNKCAHKHRSRPNRINKRGKNSIYFQLPYRLLYPCSIS